MHGHEEVRVAHVLSKLFAHPVELRLVGVDQVRLLPLYLVGRVAEQVGERGIADDDLPIRVGHENGIAVALEEVLVPLCRPFELPHTLFTVGDVAQDREMFAGDDVSRRGKLDDPPAAISPNKGELAAILI